MDRRFILFIVLSAGILLLNYTIWNQLDPPQPVAQQGAGADAKKDGKKNDEKAKGELKKGEREPGDKQPDKAPDAAEPPEVAAQPADLQREVKWFVLGSVSNSSDNPYTAGYIFTSRGAALERAELAGERFRDLEDRSGYLGQLALANTADGVQINAVVPGTPAADAKLQAGDIIRTAGGQKITDAAMFYRDVLAATRPGMQMELTIEREGQTQKLDLTLVRRPLEVIRPEYLAKGENIPQRLDVIEPGNHDPFSFLLTLAQLDKDKLKPDPEKDDELNDELPGVRLRDAVWEGQQIDAETIEFTHTLDDLGLRFVKRYRIAQRGGDGPANHVMLEVEIHNVGEKARNVAYQLDGPTGLPTEGWWYSSRISRTWSGIGIRNSAMLLQDHSPALVSPMQVADGGAPTVSEGPNLLAYAGVDAQFFASAMLPDPLVDRPTWLAEVKPILAGRMPTDKAYRTLGNVTCRLISEPTKLDPGGKPLRHAYTVFVGPKQPNLLSQYGTPTDNLSELIYYGWPIWGFFARILTGLLHVFYAVVGNYGIAIIMLTVVVRACMFPLSRKQAMAAQKMQELKPEMDKINEKYKGKPEEKTRALQELWRKHNYNPMSGCLMAFVQLPIFLGLYRALMVDVELRQAPLFGESVRWISNLSAPDMLLDWSGFMPEFITAYRGFMSLGPYLNILPIITVVLFIWQQKMFMPPATDEQTRMQQKMMRYMMILIGYMFYTVPSGLCIYFIASSLWGIAERKVLPKTIKKNDDASVPDRKPDGKADKRGEKKTGGLMDRLAEAVRAKTETNGAASEAQRRQQRKQRKQRGKK